MKNYPKTLNWEAPKLGAETIRADTRLAQATHCASPAMSWYLTHPSVAERENLWLGAQENAFMLDIAAIVYPK